MPRLRKNLIKGTLGAALTDAETTITFAAEPDLDVSGSDFYVLTLSDTEIVHLVDFEVGGGAPFTGTIVRGQGGTTAVAHDDGAAWEHGPTVADFYGQTEVYIPARDLIPDELSGPAEAADVRVWEFPDTGTTEVYGQAHIPADWTGFLVYVLWVDQTFFDPGSDVVWELTDSVTTPADNFRLSPEFGSPPSESVQGTGYTIEALSITAMNESPYACSGNSLYRFRLARDGDDGADGTSDAWLYGVRLVEAEPDGGSVNIDTAEFEGGGAPT